MCCAASGAIESLHGKSDPELGPEQLEALPSSSVSLERCFVDPVAVAAQQAREEQEKHEHEARLAEIQTEVAQAQEREVSSANYRV